MNSSKVCKVLTSPALILAISALVLALISRGLTSSYSYWLDELFSVKASISSWHELYFNTILKDTHPPLYQFILKLWINITGRSEIATRSLSFLFASGTILIFSQEAIRIRKPRRSLALALIGVSPMLAFYSQEVRSYSLALMLSSIASLLILRNREKNLGIPAEQGQSASLAFYGSALLLSLTHYYGLFWTTCLSVVNFFDRQAEPKRWKTVTFLAVSWLWPIYHLNSGSFAQKLDRISWIEPITPLLGTLRIYLQGCLPILELNSRASSILGLTLLACLALVTYGGLKERSRQEDESSDIKAVISESAYAAVTLGAMLALMAMRDLLTPMSRPQYYIIVLPITMILIANMVSILAASRPVKQWTRRAALLLAVCLIGLLVRKSQLDINEKIAPLQNWKAMAAYVDASGICRDHCYAINSQGHHSFYLKTKAQITDLSQIHANSQSLHQFTTEQEDMRMLRDKPEAVILGFHNASALVDKLMQANKDRVCLQPSQYWQNNSYVILPRNRLTGLEQRHKLLPCMGTEART